MPPSLEASTDSQALRRYLRDLASLTALPGVWIASDRRETAEGLADVLVKILDPEIVYLRLNASRGGGDRIEVTRFGDESDLPEQGRAIRRALEPWLPCDISELAVLSLPPEVGDGYGKAAVVPIGYGAEFGVVMVASSRPGFPSEEDRLLLTVAVNQAAVVLQRQAAGESQSHLAAIVESSEDAIISKTLEGVIISWNAGAEALFGHSAAEAVGQLITLIIPSDRRHEEQMILERLRRGERIEHYETVRQTKEGRLIDISLAISPVRDGTGRIVGASKVARDITLQKKAEEALKEADRRKDEFLAMLAHELRNPLAPMRHAIEILRAKGPNEPELHWARDVIERQVHQMTRLVDDLLDVSRITRGKIVLRKERVELAEVVSSAVDASRSLVEESNHQLTVTMPPDPVHLEADSARLSQVLFNLLNNAAKYTNPGGHIWLTVERERDGVSIRIRDNGIGIDPEMLPQVFEIFTQAEQSLERSHGGLGLGLAVVQSLVEMHGGTVTAHSEGIGKGTELVIRLPIRLPSRLPNTGNDTDQPPQSAGKDKDFAGLSKSRILVVDDNRDAAESLAMLLQMWGHEVYLAYDGLDAVEAAAEFQPDVVLLDIGLPKMNGYEAAHRIRQAKQDVVLIALTGWGQDEDRRRSREAGFDHHLTKPVEFEALQNMLAIKV
ncbi:MAG TPA: ATP-binding protein [Thermoanaerobaculia bacterium]|nr:ATP-binding protein [Thermoanaerobaculia bacterium]